MTDGLGFLDAGTRANGQLLASRVGAVERSIENDESAIAARELESLFATLLVRELRKGMSEGFFGKGPGADTFAGWLDETLGATLAEDGALDLAGRVKTGIETARRAAGEGAR